MSSEETSYSKAMNSLANKVWEKSDDCTSLDSSQSRIEWIRRHIVQYFVGNDNRRFLERMERKLKYLHAEQPLKGVEDIYEPKSGTRIGINPDPGSRISVLDVGSCYNPFAKLPEFDVVAIDLSPAPDSDVLRGDFVDVSVGERANDVGIAVDTRIVIDSSGHLTSIAAESFDSVVFCLLLEYLPTARLRFKVCRKAFQVLKFGGIFVVVTPDSSHQGKNLDQV